MSMKACTLIGISLMFFAVFSIMAGLHNIDLAFNMDSGCLDSNFFGRTQTRLEVYVVGFAMVLFGCLLSIGSAIAFLFQFCE